MFDYLYCTINPIPPKDLFEMFSNLGKYAESGNNVSAHLLALIGSSLGENVYNPNIKSDLDGIFLSELYLQFGFYASICAMSPQRSESRNQTTFDIDINRRGSGQSVVKYFGFRAWDPKDRSIRTSYLVQGNDTKYDSQHTWILSDPGIIMNAVSKAIQYFSTTHLTNTNVMGIAYPTLDGINDLLHGILDQPSNQ